MKTRDADALAARRKKAHDARRKAADAMWYADWRKRLDLSVVVPVEDLSRLGEPLSLDEQPGGAAAGPEARVSIWPAIHPRILELIRAHRSTIVFCNSRRLAERLAQRLNELGHKNWRGQSFTHKKVFVIRMAYHLKSRFDRLRERGMLSADELALQLGVCTATIYHWGREGFLREHRYGNKFRCLYARFISFYLVEFFLLIVFSLFFFLFPYSST